MIANYDDLFNKTKIAEKLLFNKDNQINKLNQGGASSAHRLAQWTALVSLKQKNRQLRAMFPLPPAVGLYPHSALHLALSCHEAKSHGATKVLGAAMLSAHALYFAAALLPSCCLQRPKFCWQLDYHRRASAVMPTCHLLCECWQLWKYQRLARSTSHSNTFVVLPHIEDQYPIWPFPPPDVLAGFGA